MHVYVLFRYPDPARLQAEKLQLSQHFLVHQVIQSLYHLCDSLLNLLQYVSISLVLGRPKQDPALQMCLTRAEQDLCMLTDLPNVGLSTVSLHCHKRHVAGSRSTSCPPEQWSKSVSVGSQHVPAYGTIQFLGTILRVLCWKTWWHSCCSVSAVCWCPSEWQLNHLVSEAVLLVWYCQQTKDALLSHCPGHSWLF